MFRIVEDDTPPLPDDCSEQLRDFLGQCFQKDPTKRPTAEMLCEHEWLKHNWVAGKVRLSGAKQGSLLTKPLQELRQQDSIPFLRRVSTDLQSKPSIARYLGQIDAQQSEAADSDEGPKSPGRRQSNAPSVPPTIVEPDSVPPREHSFVRTTFGKGEHVHRLPAQ
jgi:serine/threonine protein kinase